MSLKSENNVLHFYCRTAVGFLSLALIFGTAVTLLSSDAWWIRVFDFPRVQIALLIILVLAGYALLRFFGRLRTLEYALAGVVGLALIWQLIYIAPYTVVYPKQMSDSMLKTIQTVFQF